MRSILLRQSAELDEQLDNGDQLFNVLAAPLLALEVVAELLALGNPPHASMLERDDFSSNHHSRSSSVFEHDLFPKTGSHFSGSCSRASGFSLPT